MKGKCEKAGEHLQKLEALTSSVRALMGLERKD
jgi:hypothetical protein